MAKFLIITAAFVAAAGTAGAAAALYDDADASLELKWDNGLQGYQVCFYSGSDTWVANDFDISQFPAYRYVVRMKVYSEQAWPNGQWDGFRLAIFSFNGSVPGSVIWGPAFYRPNHPPVQWSWVNYSVSWTLPPGYNRFAAAFQQYYSYPNCDPHAVDRNATFQGHSWMYYSGSWRLYNNNTPYRNVMLRVVVSNNTTGVDPMSLGRVKALYR